MKCKVIRSISYGLEDEVNTWLKTGEYEIVHVTQTQTDSSTNVVLTIFYLDLKALRKAKLNKINNNDSDN